MVLIITGKDEGPNRGNRFMIFQRKESPLKKCYKLCETACAFMKSKFNTKLSL